MVKKPVLTEKQEAFAVAYIQTANATEAYRRSHDVEPDARDSWIYVEAAQLLDHPKIAPRIAELQEKASKRSEYTLFKAMKELEAARAGAMKEAQFSSAVSAVNSKVKLAGIDKPTVFDHRSSDGTMTPAIPEVVAAAARELAAKLVD